MGRTATVDPACSWVELAASLQHAGRYQAPSDPMTLILYSTFHDTAYSIATMQLHDLTRTPFHPKE